MYGLCEGRSRAINFELHSIVRRTDTFRLALSIACGFTVLDKCPLGSGRDLDLTKKYFSNAMIEPQHLNSGTIMYSIFL